MKRGFEKISFDQFKKDVSDDKEEYNEYNLPKRGSIGSAGYDFYAITDVVIKPNAVVKIPTGVKAYMVSDEALLLIVRSSTGFKYNIRLTNQVGVIDSDYYNNVNNEGHMWISLQNHGVEDFVIKKGDRIIQGVFINTLRTDDDECDKIRTGGIGSTNNRGE